VRTSPSREAGVGRVFLAGETFWVHNRSLMPIGYLKVVSASGRTTVFDVFPYRDSAEDERRALQAAEARAREIRGRVVSWLNFDGALGVIGESC
jgi:hypothetical protein